MGKEGHGGHDHGHHHHHHHHGGATHGRAFLIGMTLNFAFVVVEVVYGLLSRSMALVADAGHNLGDVLGLGLAWGAALLARRAPSVRHTYGLRRTTILASLLNAVTLVLVTGAIAWESLRRLFHPEAVDEKLVIVVALVGVVINGLSAVLFLRDRERDLNVGSAFAHLAADAALALGVAVAGVVILFTGWLWLDPVVSIVLSITILFGSWSLLRTAIDLALDAVPQGVDVAAIRAFLTAQEHVDSVHDLHIWALSTTEVALTAHLSMPAGTCDPHFIAELCQKLHDQFGIEHSTLQVEAAESRDKCRLASDDGRDGLR
jgi:cobalt-zinc-cadmium efflux system protein